MKTYEMFSLELNSDTNKYLGHRVVRMWRKIVLISSAIKFKKLNHIGITINPTEKNGFNSWYHWTLIGPDEDISNILKCAWKQNNTLLLGFFPFYCYDTQWSWRKSWDEEYRGEYPVGIEI